MILLDAVYINDSGGKILLDYFITELEKTNKKICYLLDERLRQVDYQIKSSNELIYLKASLKDRKYFYKRNVNKFSTVLCFANIPPNIKLAAKVYVYFHQKLFLETPSTYTIKAKVLLWLKRKVLINFKKNTDIWITQSNVMAKLLADKVGIDIKNISILPFYPILPYKERPKEKYSYLYVSNGHVHKNHLNLIESFCKFYDLNKKGKLILTISKDFSSLFNLIEYKQQKGYPIINHGNVPREKLSEIYQSAEFLIFPSLSESFGLGLVEAIDNKCKVIAADLPYTYAVCEPSLVFDPKNIDSIIGSLSLSLNNNIKSSFSKVENNINKLIELLK